jgi:hypothetical protein
VAGQTKFNGNMLSAEWKLPESSAIRAANLAEMGNPALRQIRTSASRQIDAKFPIRQTATGGVVRVASHSGSNPDTATETITWSKFVEDFSIGMSLADNNLLEWSELYAAAKRNAILNLISRVDASFVASLIADETTASAGGGNGAFDAVGDEYQLPSAYGENFFGEVKAMMNKNLYSGNLIGIVDSQGGVLADRLGRDGSGNANNTAAQLAGYAAIVPTSRTLLSTVTYNGSGIFYQNGLVGVNFWTPPKNRKTINAQKAMMDSVGDFGSFAVPEFPGVEFGHSIYAGRSDQSGVGGDEQDIVIHEEISLEMAYVSAPVSAFHTETSPIFTAGLLV